MKILMATMGLDIGGAETHIVELAKELKAEGHDIVVACSGHLDLLCHLRISPCLYLCCAAAKPHKNAILTTLL